MGSVDFPCQLGEHCQCERDGDNIKYSLYGCTFREQHLYPGDYTEYNCTEYTCKETDDRAYVMDVSQTSESASAMV